MILAQYIIYFDLKISYQEKHSLRYSSKETQEGEPIFILGTKDLIRQFAKKLMYLIFGN